jgi:hypothetical protein
MVIDDTMLRNVCDVDTRHFTLMPAERAALERGDRGEAREGDEELLRAALQRARRTLTPRGVWR